MAAKTCPTCGLIHRASATRCECGYDFDQERQDPPVDRRRKPLAWHEEPLLGVAALVICWPAGLFLVWQNKHISNAVKTLITVSWFGLFLALAAYRMAQSTAAPVSP
jgi:hypothetical protein